MAFERKVDLARYTFVEKQDGDTVINGIRLEDEEYLGFIFAYNGRVQFAEEDNEDGSRDISFDYDVLQMGTLIEEDLTKAPFKQLLGNLLIDIITEQLENAPDTIKFVND
jgi:hypothetical protein